MKIISATDSEKKKLEAVTAATQSFEKELEAASEAGGRMGDTLGNSLLRTISLLAIAKKGIDLMLAGLKSAATMEIQRNSLISLTGSEEVGGALYDYGESFARESQLDQNSVVQTLITMTNHTRDGAEMDRGLRMLERLYMKDPSQGTDGAMFALKELMEGDTMSARNRYGMLGISGEDLRNAATFSDRLDIIDAEMKKVGATEGIVAANTDNLLSQWSMFTSNLTTDWGTAMDGATDKATTFVATLNEMQELGVFRQSMTLLANAAYGLAGGLVWVGQNLTWLLPLAQGVAVALIVYKTGTLLAAAGTAVLTAASQLSAMALGTVGVAATATMSPLIALITVLSVLVGVYFALTGAANNAGRSMAAAAGVDPALGTEEALKNLQKTLGDAPGAELPVTVQNPGPISVKGEVEIEDQSLKYLYDLAEERRMNRYAGTTVYMENSFGDIRETADVDAVLDEMLYRTQNELRAVPAGG